jgi:sulfotransferase
MKTYHFISGLPRSGSTLLSAILKQNPKFTAGISDPLHSYIHSIIKDTNTAAGMDAAVPIEKRRDIIKDLFDSFYKTDREVCFNTNRSWSADTSLLKNLYPNFKMIVCVRNVLWILDSFEQLNSKNPFTIKPLYHHQDLGNVHDRCRMLMGEIPNFGGYVYGPLVNVQQSMFSNEVNQICYIDYDTLVKSPRECMLQIYKFLGEPWYEHDFDNVEDSYDEFDTQAKISGLHTVRKRVEYKERRSILPGELWDRYSSMNFWKSFSDEQNRMLNWINPSFNSIKNSNNVVDKIMSRCNNQIPTFKKQL